MVAKQLVFIPIAEYELAAITGAVRLTGRSCHRVTPELLAALEYEPQQVEEAEYAALVLASVAALARYGQRLVLVAEVDHSLVSDGADLANGECLVSTVPTAAMTCWFADSPEVDIASAAAAANGLDIDTAWGFDEVQHLLATADLMWNDVAEYRRAVGS